MRLHGTENNSFVMLEMGRRLHDLRVNSRLTQKELAEKAGVSELTIARVESGNAIRMDYFLNLLRIMGCLGNIEILIPEQEALPSDLMKGVKRKQRVRHGKEKPRRPWKWGDEH